MECVSFGSRKLWYNQNISVVLKSHFIFGGKGEIGTSPNRILLCEKNQEIKADIHEEFNERRARQNWCKQAQRMSNVVLS